MSDKQTTDFRATDLTALPRRRPATSSVLVLAEPDEEIALDARRIAAPEPRATHPRHDFDWLLHDVRLARLAQKCRQRLPHALGYRRGILYLYDADRGMLTSTAGIGAVVPLGDSGHEALAAVAQRHEPLKLHRGDGAATLLAPLRDAGRLWGVLALHEACEDEVTLSPAVLRRRLRSLARTLRQALEFERVRDEARLDGLTGLLNHRALLAALAGEVRRAQRFNTPLSLLAIDLDGLKGVNDRIGHPAGDALLRQFGRRIRAGLREFDTAGRSGGDEFLVILPSTELDGARHVGRRILEDVRANPASFRGTPLALSASVGAAQWRPDWSAQDLIEATDEALYVAKQRGRDQLVCRSVESPGPPAHSSKTTRS